MPKVLLLALTGTISSPFPASRAAPHSTPVIRALRGRLPRLRRRLAGLHRSRAGGGTPHHRRRRVRPGSVVSMHLGIQHARHCPGCSPMPAACARSPRQPCLGRDPAAGLPRALVCSRRRSPRRRWSRRARRRPRRPRGRPRRSTATTRSGRTRSPPRRRSSGRSPASSMPPVLNSAEALLRGGYAAASAPWPAGLNLRPAHQQQRRLGDRTGDQGRRAGAERQREVRVQCPRTTCAASTRSATTRSSYSLTLRAAAGQRARESGSPTRKLSLPTETAGARSVAEALRANSTSTTRTPGRCSGSLPVPGCASIDDMDFHRGRAVLLASCEFGRSRMIVVDVGRETLLRSIPLADAAGSELPAPDGARLLRRARWRTGLYDTAGGSSASSTGEGVHSHSTWTGSPGSCHSNRGRAGLRDRPGQPPGDRHLGLRGRPDMGGVSADGSAVAASRCDGVVYALRTADGRLLAAAGSGPGRAGCACGRSPAGTPSATPQSSGEAAAPTTRGGPTVRSPTLQDAAAGDHQDGCDQGGNDSTDMNSFARVDSGIVSVGLNAVELVVHVQVVDEGRHPVRHLARRGGDLLHRVVALHPGRTGSRPAASGPSASASARSPAAIELPVEQAEAEDVRQPPLQCGQQGPAILYATRRDGDQPDQHTSERTRDQRVSRVPAAAGARRRRRRASSAGAHVPGPEDQGVREQGVERDGRDLAMAAGCFRPAGSRGHDAESPVSPVHRGAVQGACGRLKNGAAQPIRFATLGGSLRETHRPCCVRRTPRHSRSKEPGLSVDPLRLSAGSSPGGATVLISAADAGIDVGADRRRPARARPVEPCVRHRGGPRRQAGDPRARRRLRRGSRTRRTR